LVSGFTRLGSPGRILRVMDAFEKLGLGLRLVISAEELGAAYREAGKAAHPDAGGGEGAFAALREAMAVVSSPSRRLRAWLEIQGASVDLRGTIESGLMDFFSEVGAVTQQAESVIRKREEAKSALVRAMLEGETQVAREAVESAISRVEERIGEGCATFPALETAAEPDEAAASQTARNLAFLEKWRVNLRALYSRLV
jgi:curved DNA-binding protein CbpA